jgi:hypothetical protein
MTTTLLITWIEGGKQHVAIQFGDCYRVTSTDNPLEVWTTKQMASKIASRNRDLKYGFPTFELLKAIRAKEEAKKALQ